MNKLIALSIFLSQLPFSLEAETQEQEQVTHGKNNTLAIGFEILDSNCFACHSPKPTSKNPIAPPISDIKKHYIRTQKTLENFITEMTSFVIEPRITNSKMPHAIQSYGLMPKLNFNEKQLKAVATYIFDTPIETTDWYESQYQTEKRKHQATLSNQMTSPLEQGKKYVSQTKANLGKNLLQAINTKGAVGALNFCNENATELTEDTVLNKNVHIKRVSDLNRNPKNAANLNELEYISNAKALLKQQQKITPVVIEKENKTIGYYPILTNQMCLQCHGLPDKDIKPATLNKIQELYPEDKATGYGANELRGIWVIEMNDED